jgi:hypothetical protein
MTRSQGILSTRKTKHNTITWSDQLKISAGLGEKLCELGLHRTWQFEGWLKF